MDILDATQFWQRYKELVAKDLPVILTTSIKQPTLSSWRTKKIFPRADEAFLIAKAINTTVEYLVSGQDKAIAPFSRAALDIAITADKLSDEGKNLLASVASCLLDRYSKPID